MSAQSSGQINVLVVVDADYIVNNYPRPSTDQENPTVLDRESQYMICASPRGMVVDQGTADLDFRANVGDVVSFGGISIHANSSAAVILYGIELKKGNHVFEPQAPEKVIRQGAVVPDPARSNGPESSQQSLSYISHKLKIQQAGTESLFVDIALYVLAKDGQAQDLYGYFRWNPSVTVREIAKDGGL